MYSYPPFGASLAERNLCPKQTLASYHAKDSRGSKAAFASRTQATSLRQQWEINTVLNCKETKAQVADLRQYRVSGAQLVPQTDSSCILPRERFAREQSCFCKQDTGYKPAPAMRNKYSFKL
ncbi:hypothetical protein D0T49_12140 [Paludibacter sp. 221]|nr:hypothetical protein [Paludibacter sp. 221]